MQLRNTPDRLIQEMEAQARGVSEQFSNLLGVADAVTGVRRRSAGRSH